MNNIKKLTFISALALSVSNPTFAGAQQVVHVNSLTNTIVIRSVASKEPVPVYQINISNEGKMMMSAK